MANTGSTPSTVEQPPPPELQVGPASPASGPSSPPTIVVRPISSPSGSLTDLETPTALNAPGSLLEESGGDSGGSRRSSGCLRDLSTPTSENAPGDERSAWDEDRGDGDAAEAGPGGAGDAAGPERESSTILQRRGLGDLDSPTAGALGLPAQPLFGRPKAEAKEEEEEEEGRQGSAVLELVDDMKRQDSGSFHTGLSSPPPRGSALSLLHDSPGSGSSSSKRGSLKGSNPKAAGGKVFWDIFVVERGPVDGIFAVAQGVRRSWGLGTEAKEVL